MPKILWIGKPFLASFFAPHAEIVHVSNPGAAHLITEHRDADFAITLNADLAEIQWRRPLLAICRTLGIPRCHWNIDDPNHWAYFGAAVRRIDYDVVFTSDLRCIEQYKRRTFVHPRVHFYQVLWLPLAAAPEYHRPLPLADNAADFVLVAQSYLHWPARRAAAKEVVRPLLSAGYSLKLFCPEGGWEEEPDIAKHRVGGECYTEDCAEHYRHGRIALGMNCQAGMNVDMYHGTAMTSMRTFETLACGKPLLAYQSTAYAQLGFENGRHFRWVGSGAEALDAARDLLNNAPAAIVMAEEGRQFVLANHTYKYRLQRILDAIDGKAKAGEWR